MLCLPFLKMLEEYMSLFRLDRFNLCADETFDLGKGKSAALAAEKKESPVSEEK